ncbi:O-unit flippase-like protein [Pseudoalteromonas distincta]
MPFALVAFTEAEFSLWMVFVAFYALIVVFDFGLSSTFSRQINYVLCGAQSLNKVGVCEQVDKSSINYLLFSKIINSAKFVFFFIAIITVAILGAAYFFFLNPIAAKSGLDISLEWLLYSLAIIINIFCLLYNALFFGTNNVASIYKVTSFSNLTFFAFAITLILYDYTLMAVAIARLLSAVTYYLSANYEINKLKMLHGYVKTHWQDTKATLGVLLPNAGRIGVVSLGNFMLTKLSILIVAYYFTASESASYSLALNLFTILSSVSLLYMTVVTPILNRAIQNTDFSLVKKLQFKVRLVCLITCLLGCVSVLVIVPELLKLIDSKTSLPSVYVLVFFSLMVFLDVNRQLSMNLIAATNHIPFYKAIVFSGSVSLLVIIAVLELGYLSLLTPVIVSLCVQTLFNNWYWTLMERNILAKKGM